MKNIIVIGLFAILGIGCTSNAQDTSVSKQEMIPSYNKGGYTIDISNPANSDSVSISGRVVSTNDESIFPGTTIKYGCKKISTDESGSFAFKSAVSDLDLQVIANSVGYMRVETKPLKVKKGDSLNVNFYLAPDERPMINCESVAE